VVNAVVELCKVEISVRDSSVFVEMDPLNVVRGKLGLVEETNSFLEFGLEVGRMCVVLLGCGDFGLDIFVEGKIHLSLPQHFIIQKRAFCLLLSAIADDKQILIFEPCGGYHIIPMLTALFAFVEFAGSCTISEFE
jgi:hypothetical protein